MALMVSIMADESSSFELQVFTSGVPGQHHAEGYLTRKCLDWLDKGRDPQRPYLSLPFF